MSDSPQLGTPTDGHPAAAPQPESATPAATVAPADWVTPPTPGEVITSLSTRNSYTMGEKIGEGHFGLVYSCTDVWNNNLAAKILKPLAPYDEVRSSAEAELGKLQLLRHPYITYVFDAFEYRETFYIITERCYCPLSNLVSFETFNGFEWMKPIARCLLQAVHYLHANQYAHQDIHLDNVFVAIAKDEMQPDGPGALNFKLGDLGVAKLFNEIDGTNTRAQWMLPPEALDSSEFGPLDRRVDIYHCGLLFLQLAHSKDLRFSAEEIRAGKPREMALQLRSPFNFALEKALRRHVQYRTESAMELWRDLNSPEQPTQADAKKPQAEGTQEAFPPPNAANQ